MSSISINYLVLSDIEEENIKNIIDSCDFDNHSISLVFNDFSLNKKTKAIVEKLNIGADIRVNDYDYEDSKNSMNIVVKNFASYAASDFVTIVHQDLLFNKISVSKIDFDILNEENIGFIYGDYSINNVRCYLRSHAAHVKLSIPFVFWSTKKIVQHVSQENLLDYLFSKYTGIHIPHDLCTVSPDDKQ